jgi:opacity protein-like surface antigen
MLKYLMIYTLLFSHFLPNVGYSFCFQNFSYKPLPGLYIGGMGGLNGGYDLKCETLLTDLGYYLGAKAGKRFFPTLRPFFPNLQVEEEFIWQRNPINTIKAGTFQLDHIRGHIQIWSLMTNILLDFNCDFPVRPFIGGGLGYAQAWGHWSAFLIDVNGDFFLIEKHIKSKLNKRGFAAQVIAGLKYFIYPNLEASLEYRFFNLKNHIANHKLGLALTKFF